VYNITMAYSKRCSVCQYLRKHKAFRIRLLDSTYFNPEGHETLMDVVRNMEAPLSKDVLYQHFRKHEPQLRPSTPLENTVQIVETGDKNHIDTLDLFIQQGKELLKRKQLTITSTNLLQAIKVKSDDEKANKDRKVDLLRTMFAGAGPQTVQVGPKTNARVDPTTKE